MYLGTHIGCMDRKINISIAVYVYTYLLFSKASQVT